MPPGKDPPERTESRTPTPAPLSAAALDRAHALNKPADHGEQQIKTEQPHYSALHHVASPPMPQLERIQRRDASNSSRTPSDVRASRPSD
jgi:hypothetical protein